MTHAAQPPRYAGIYAAALKHPLLSKADELALCTRYSKLRAKRGATHPSVLRLRNQIVMSHLRLAAKIACRYTKLPFEDLMSEGVKGLIRAAERYEPERGYRFGTMACHWVRSAVQTAVRDLGDAVRLPENKHAKMRNGELVADGVMLLARPMSLDAPMSGTEDSTLYDLIECDDVSALEQLGVRKVRADLLRVIEQTLTVREREVIARRFLSGDDETLNQVGARMRRTNKSGQQVSRETISRERVRQIERESLARLRDALERVGITRETAL